MLYKSTQMEKSQGEVDQSGSVKISFWLKVYAVMHMDFCVFYYHVFEN